MSTTFTPAKGAELWQMSNPPILSLAPVVASLQIFQEVGMAALVEKSTSLTSYLAWLLEQRFGGRIGTITPADDCGCQLSLVVKDSQVSARRMFDNLCARNVTGDWREPDVIRVAPVPLYNSYSDVYELVDRLNSAL
jgi:kynureninase